MEDYLHGCNRKSYLRQLVETPVSGYRIFSWNVNGVRAVVRKGFVEWIRSEKPDIICLQETKAQEDQIPKDLTKIEDYDAYWNSGQVKGYSGVGTLHHRDYDPLKVEWSLGVRVFDVEGRILISRYPEFILFNVYFPNGKKNEERLDYKMRFYEHFLDLCQGYLDAGLSMLVCGDVNTAHREIDLEHPRPNSKRSGFLPQEREWIDRFLEAGFVDSLRLIHGDKEKMYTWWSYRSKTARANNVGWRIDYFFISKDLIANLTSAEIHTQVEGSDHCPISITLTF